MIKLTLRERLLYKRKAFDQLHQFMYRTKEGAARFNQLCIQDTRLQEWQGRMQLQIVAETFKDPKVRAAMKQALEKQGRGTLFKMYERLHEKGFVTIQEAAEAFGMTRDELRDSMTKYPALFTELHISER